jgi:Tol biopolymer transport system component
MTLNDGFDRTVSDWLDDQAGRGAPGYLDEVLIRTIRTRQRPAWSSLERWLPVQTTLRFAPVPRIAWLLVILALVAVLGVAVLGVGSRPRQPASPFGLARNGAILYSGTDNDIHALDPVTGSTRALITGSSGDHGPLLSPNGTRLLFLRDTTVTDPVIGGLEPMIMVANDDGSAVRALTGALVNFNGARWSNGGSKVVVASDVDSKPALQVVSMDGTSAPVVIDTQGMTPMYVAFRPDDRELTFRGSTPTGDGLYAVGADGRGLRTILAPSQGDGASLSPDGTKLAYQVWDGTYGTIHVVDVDTGVDSIPVFDPDAARTGSVDGEPWAWSPDGDRFLFVRYSVGNSNHLAVAPATGGHVVEIGPAMPNDATGGHTEFSPDGTTVLVHYNSDGSTWLLDPTGVTEGQQLSSGIAGSASWQRSP